MPFKGRRVLLLLLLRDAAVTAPDHSAERKHESRVREIESEKQPRFAYHCYCLLLFISTEVLRKIGVGGGCPEKAATAKHHFD